MPSCGTSFMACTPVVLGNVSVKGHSTSNIFGALLAGNGTKLPELKPMVLVSLVLMMLTVGASGWVYFNGTRSVRETARAEGLYNFDRSRPSSNPVAVDPAGIDPDQKIPRLLRQVDA